MELFFNIVFMITMLMLCAASIIMTLAQARRMRKVKNLDHEYNALINELREMTISLNKKFIDKSLSFDQNVAEMDLCMKREYKDFLSHIRYLKSMTSARAEFPVVYATDFGYKQKPTETIKKKYTPIEELPLSQRTINALISSEIGSIEKLVEYTEEQLSFMNRIGTHTIFEINNALASRGLTLTSKKYE